MTKQQDKDAIFVTDKGKRKKIALKLSPQAEQEIVQMKEEIGYDNLKEITHKMPQEKATQRCPCCNRKMWKLESGQWTHLPSLVLEEAEHSSCQQGVKEILAPTTVSPPVGSLAGKIKTELEIFHMIHDSIYTDTNDLNRTKELVARKHKWVPLEDVQQMLENIKKEIDKIDLHPAQNGMIHKIIDKEMK